MAGLSSTFLGKIILLCHSPTWHDNTPLPQLFPTWSAIYDLLVDLRGKTTSLFCHHSSLSAYIPAQQLAILHRPSHSASDSLQLQGTCTARPLFSTFSLTLDFWFLHRTDCMSCKAYIIRVRSIGRLPKLAESAETRRAFEYALLKTVASSELSRLFHEKSWKNLGERRLCTILYG